MAKYHFDSAFEKMFIAACQHSSSLAQTALKLGMNYKTLRFHARRLDCFKPNPAGMGIKKKAAAVSLEQIFDGSFKTYQSHKLKIRLIKEGYKQAVCECCKLSHWLHVPIPLELHHVDGNRYNNALSNIQLLCPNCHALTSNYRAKNISNLSALRETGVVEPLKFGEALAKEYGNPEPSSVDYGKGVET